MSYTPEHKQETRARIVKRARQLFNRHGFTEVSIDEIMAAAGLTRGGFYNHFKTKEDLYVETLAVYAAERREETPNDLSACGPDIAREMLNRYISRRHLDNLDGHCPLMALPSDVARAGPNVRAAYQDVLEAMVYLFEGCLGAENGMSARQRGLAMAATCVGAMVLSRTIDDPNFADEICDAARTITCDAIAPTVDDRH